MTVLSYDPPDRSDSELLLDIVIEDEEGEVGTAREAAEFLHHQLVVLGERHTLEADADTRTVALRTTPETAMWLACLIQQTGGKLTPIGSTG
jgi:hypothetical protein